MARITNRFRQPHEVAEKTNSAGETQTVGRDGKAYKGKKRGPKFAEEKYGKPLDGKRARRLRLIIRSFVRDEGNLEETLKTFLNDIEDPEEKAAILEDPWFKRNFEGTTAGHLIEEAILNNITEIALSKLPSAGQAAKTLLQAVNKHRYNPGVQKQETANEGLAKIIRGIGNKPMTYLEMKNIFVLEQPLVPIKDMEAIEVPTLEEEVETAKAEGRYIEDHRIREDKDLRTEGEE